MIGGPICFVTNVYHAQYYSLGTNRLIKSAKYFHPQIPFFILSTDWIEEKGGGLTGTWFPQSIKEFIDNYEWVVRIDADCIIVGYLKELMEAIVSGKYDVIAVRNNNDDGKAGKDIGITQPGRDCTNYANAGLVATRSREFISEWAWHNKMYADMLPFSEQTTLNALIQKYPTFILDTIYSNVYYGVSGLFGNGTETETHWDSWKEIKVADRELQLNNKVIKILHHAGGNLEYKLGLHMFSDAARKRIIEISE